MYRIPTVFERKYRGHHGHFLLRKLSSENLKQDFSHEPSKAVRNRFRNLSSGSMQDTPREAENKLDAHGTRVPDLAKILLPPIPAHFYGGGRP